MTLWHCSIVLPCFWDLCFWVKTPPSVFDSGDTVRGSSKALVSGLGFYTESEHWGNESIFIQSTIPVVLFMFHPLHHHFAQFPFLTHGINLDYEKISAHSGGGSGKEPACQCKLDIRGEGLIPGLRRSLGGGHGNWFQCSCQENPVDSRAWQTAVHGAAQPEMTEAT